jgi:hypothetical protein
MSKGTSGIEGSGDETGKPLDPAAAIGSGDGDGGITDSAGNRFDPTIHSSPDSRTKDGEFRRKRGRKSSGNSAKSKAHVQADIKETAVFLTQGLMLFHTSIAAMTATPEMVLEEDEAKAVSESALTLAAMYDITPDPKLQAMMNFAIIMGTTYGTRIIAIRARKSQERKEKKPGTAGVYSAEGEPMGTTEYKTENTEWPLGPTPQTIM